MALVLVTGGTGFIGQHLVRHLLARGDRVRCLVRRPDAAPPGVEVMRGDVTMPESLPAAVRDVEVVYHLAGANLEVGKHGFQRVNAEGTRSLAQACGSQPRPPVVVYASSLAAAGPSGLDRPLTELDPPQPVSRYGRSKLAAEEHLRAAAPDLPVTIVRPPAVFGPGDHYTIKMYRLASRGFALLPGRSIFRLSWIYVTDLVEAMTAAAERGTRLAPAADHDRAGQGVYYVALDEHPLVTDAARLAASVQGVSRVRIVRVPAFLCRFGAAVNALRTPLTGRGYWVNPDKICEALAGSWTCDSGKAKRELGFVYRTGLPEGFRLTYEWYRDQGWL